LHGVLFSIAVKVEQLRSTVTGLTFLEAIIVAISGIASPEPVAKLVIQAENKAIAINDLVFIIIIMFRDGSLRTKG
jgi:hypothetical protein